MSVNDFLMIFINSKHDFKINLQFKLYTNQSTNEKNFIFKLYMYITMD